MLVIAVHICLRFIITLNARIDIFKEFKIMYSKLFASLMIHEMRLANEQDIID